MSRMNEIVAYTVTTFYFKSVLQLKNLRRALVFQYKRNLNCKNLKKLADLTKLS